jgi:hypothetical protein
MRKLFVGAAALLAFGAMGIGSASAQSTSGTSECTSKSHSVKDGDRTVTDTIRECKLVRGGHSRTVTHRVSVKTSAGTITDTRTVSDGTSVSKKGKVTVRHSVKVCHKDAGARTECTTTSN